MARVFSATRGHMQQRQTATHCNNYMLWQHQWQSGRVAERQRVLHVLLSYLQFMCRQFTQTARCSPRICHMPLPQAPASSAYGLLPHECEQVIRKHIFELFSPSVCRGYCCWMVAGFSGILQSSLVLVVLWCFLVVLGGV